MTQHELLAQIFEIMPIPAFIVDADLRVVATNQALRNRYAAEGVDPEHVLGYTIMQAFPFLPAHIPDKYRQVFARGEVVSDEAVYEFSHGTVSVEVSRLPIFNNGKVTHIGIVFRDVTEHKKMQEALRHSEETARALMNSSTESMFLIAENETLIAANTIGAERLGITVGELEGMTIDQMMPPDIGNSRVKYYRQVRDSGKPVRFSDKRMGRTFDITMFPVPGPEDRPRRVAVFARDVTDYESMLRALGESELRFRDLFQHIPVPTYVWRWNGADFVLQKANSGAEEITDGQIGRFIGMTATAMYANEYPEVLTNMRECLSAQSRFTREMQYTFRSTGQKKFLQVHYVFVPPQDILLHVIDLTARRDAEQALQESYAGLEQKVAERTRELAALNDQLRVEHESLNQKNAALRELIVQVNDSKKTLASHIQTNLRLVALPILERLGSRLDDAGKNYLQMLREALDDILSPHLTELKRIHPQLTPHEVDLCNLIKSGFTCKEIAEMRGRAEQTILKQRKLIRKKLGLADEKINLRNYLSSVGTEIYSK
ncbi:MAG: PAS domain-containing protein [candidate division Zixibacteria bacterium]|nr:PAS domain-containing protein [candidate division Zixibacteria bacterium]